MSNFVHTAARNEKGFTLVELAVVMIIVGLLIGGILKGQEMIANAQVTSTAAQAKAMDAATSTFRDQYKAFPGDMANADVRLTNCTAVPCFNAGTPDGDGVIDLGVGEGNSNADEGGFYFNQLRAANLISGGFTGEATDTFGTAFPQAEAGGGFQIGHTTGTVTGFDGGQLRVGHYLSINGAVADVGAATGALTPSQAGRIDSKLDDGAANSGSVVAQEDAGECVAAAGDAVYAEAETDFVCAIAIRVQG